MTPGNRYVPPPPPLDPREKTGSPGWLKFLIIIVVAGAAVGIGIKMEEGKERKEKEKRFLTEMEKTGEEVKNDMRRRANSKDGLTVEDGAEALAKVKSTFDKAAGMGGEEGKTMKVMSDFMGTLQGKVKIYSDHAKIMENESVFDLTNVKARQDLARRRQMGLDMIRLNAELGTFFAQSENYLRAALAKEGITGTKAEGIMRGFSESRSKTSGAQIKVRACDDIIGKALIEMCDLLDGEWGKWKNGKEGPEFDSTAVLTRYNEIITRVQKASEDQAQAQRDMVNAKR